MNRTWKIRDNRGEYAGWELPDDFELMSAGDRIFLDRTTIYRRIIHDRRGRAITGPSGVAIIDDYNGKKCFTSYIRMPAWWVHHKTRTYLVMVYSIEDPTTIHLLLFGHPVDSRDNDVTSNLNIGAIKRARCLTMIHAPCPEMFFDTIRRFADVKIAWGNWIPSPTIKIVKEVEA